MVEKNQTIEERLKLALLEIEKLREENKRLRLEAKEQVPVYDKSQMRV